MRFLRFSSLWLAAVAGVSAAEFTAQIVDGLGRPISGVQVKVSCASPQQKMQRYDLMSDPDGTIHGMYDTAVCKPISVSVRKEGYESYDTGFRARYVVRPLFSAREVLRVVKLDGDSQERELRELLAGDFANEEHQFRDSVFVHEARLRPALRSLAHDPEVTLRARDLLSMIGVSEDIHLIMQLARPPILPGFAERWRYAVATALVNPDNEDEWSFLRGCALNEFNDHWVDAGAIQTLKLTGSPRSRKILEEARQKNKAQAPLIVSALDYVKSNPAPLVSANLEALAKRVAQAIKLGAWEGNGTPRFNEAGDKALVDFTFKTFADILVYTATFHKIDGRWTLRGARETWQGFAPGTVGRRQ